MKINNTNDIELHHVFALIVGRSGSGKTYTASTLPPKETLILSLESGLLTIKGTGIDVWEIESFSDFVGAIKKLQKGVEYKHIFIDSFTELTEMCFDELRPHYEKRKNFDLYEEFTKRMISMVKMFRDMAEYNFFMTCTLKETSEGSIILDIPQKSLGLKMPKYFDFCFLVDTFDKDGESVRALVSDNSVLPMLKSRSSKILAYEKVDLNGILEKALQ